MVVGKVQGVMSVSCFPGSAGSVGVEGGSSFRMWRAVAATSVDGGLQSFPFVVMV